MSPQHIFISMLVLTLLTGAVEAVRAEQSEPGPTTIDARKNQEATSSDSPLKQRLNEEKSARGALFSILPHKTNYLLPATYNTTPNSTVYAGVIPDSEKLDNVETQFQLSIKTPLWDDIFDGNGTLFAAYSQLAFWQAYNSGYSSPFREINFEPELFLSFDTGFEFMGVTSNVVMIGLDHQSNGHSKPISRSWNRITGNFVFGSGNTYISLRPWFRIPEKSSDDDNPHMEKYYGYGELSVLHKWGKHTVTMMLRNNLRSSENKGAIQLDWSFPLHKQLRGYVQFFNGFGESLIDYDHANNRIGVGVMLTDWL